MDIMSTTNRKCGDVCNKPLDQTVVCKKCSSIAHVTCYGLNKTIARVLSESNNLAFFCDDCVILTNDNNDVCSNQVCNSSKDVVEAISELKDVIMGLQKSIQPPISYKSVLSGDVINHGSAKRRRLVDESSTPTGFPRARPNTPTIRGTNAIASTLVTVEPRKLIFVSQLNPSTKESDIVDYVNNQLGDVFAKPKVNSLIPRGKLLSDLDYISFKLSIPEKHLDKVLSAEFWPKNVMVREFKNFPRVNRRPVASFLPETQTVEQVSL